ncbi:capsular biosynthesis protein [Cylindrospermopsis raciborskii C04]|uniref:Capsular biosynthesis protein n=1 Tax=Cylindrospermopsis raciborskii C07 TaxID=2014886 RepID=A0ABX4WIR1_9CYAN|nr:polysaccharide biosynthesis tyrosine autokinase [Cylindrospermopsis raciborskii]PNJ92600.1 capsular biosynthesis protein [Cylindrospermopsis raciborskii C07]PNJ93426.1 capsular biosynthesis protein [Cylindrospermopsis raciborskii C03]PNJ95005.1 capsular biosynthesis protein [Cylindrospermopsis raciborskii C04]
MNSTNESKSLITREKENIILQPEVISSGNLISLQTTDDDIDLKEIMSILKRRALGILTIASLIMAGGSYYLFTAEKIYQGSFEILVEPVSGEKNNLLTAALESTQLDQSGLDYDSQIKVLKSPELLNQVLPDIQSQYPELTFDLFIKNLAIQRSAETKVLEITYKSPDRAEIDLVLNTLSKFYLKYSLEKRKTKLNQGLRFIDEQLPRIGATVDQLQRELQVFRQRYKFVNPEDQSGKLVEQIQSLETQRIAIEQKLAVARTSYATLLTPEGQQAALNQTQSQTQSPYNILVIQLRQIEAQLSGELARFQGDNPYITTLEEKRQNILPLIEKEKERYIGLKIAEVANTILLLESENREITRAQEQSKARFDLLPRLARQNTDLQRKLQLASESLNRFLEAQEKLAIEVAQTEIPWELVQAPITPELPVFPKIYQSLLLGLIGSLSISVAIAFLLEKLDNSYHDAINMQERTKLPLLGTLPRAKNIGFSYQSRHDSDQRQNKPAKTNPLDIPLLSFSRKKRKKIYGYGEGHFWQSLQVLYANIQLLNSDEVVKSLAITSALKGEGKSTLALHLAQMAASVGRRVLLVDTDLRLPQIHKRLNLPNLVGLSNVITSNLTPDEVMQKLPDLDTLSVITSGTQPPDPMRLISSEKMKQMMAYFREKFDLVIYDTPPVMGIVDARLVASQTDGLILVVKMHKTDRSIIKQAQDALRQSSISILGVVANQYNKTIHQYHDYYYGYTYGGRGKEAGSEEQRINSLH